MDKVKDACMIIGICFTCPVSVPVLGSWYAYRTWKQNNMSMKLKHIKKYLLPESIWEENYILMGWKQNGTNYILLDEKSTIYAVCAQIQDLYEAPNRFVFIRTDKRHCIPSLVLNCMDIADNNQDSSLCVINLAESPSELVNLETSYVVLDTERFQLKDLFNITYVSV